MNIALPAILLFLFILPGLFFNLAFFRPKDVLLNFTSLTAKVMVGFSVAFILHIIWISLICYLLGYIINFSQIMALVSGVQNEIYITAISSISLQQIYDVAIYLISICIFVSLHLYWACFSDGA